LEVFCWRFKHSIWHGVLGANPFLINYLDLLFLGAFTGLTILPGLALAVVQTVTPKKNGFINPFAIGILIFLIVDVLSHA
jgi:ZIP family zinc transporter